MRFDIPAGRLVWCAAFTAAGLGGFGGFSGAAAQQPQRPDCSAPEYRQFDFWVGEWTVTDPAGKAAGVNRISRILKDCVLLEEWTGAGGGSGKSYNVYSRSDGKWHQTWVDDAGSLLLLAGGLREGSMVLEGETTARSGNAVTNRITWSIMDDNPDTVRQHWQVSTDGGTTWTTSFDGVYRRNR